MAQNNKINVLDSVNNGCANKSDVTGETIGDQRAIHTKDIDPNKATLAEQQAQTTLMSDIKTCLEQLKANKEIKIADETISALKLVRATSGTNIALAQPTMPLANSTVIGVSRTSGNVGEEVEIVTFGEVSDSTFNFGVNEMLFLGPNGTITNVAPTTGVLTRIGYGLGPGKIFVNVQDPICL